MKFEAMFQPVKIGNMTVPNRFVMSPMGNNFANTDGKMMNVLQHITGREQKADLD